MGSRSALRHSIAYALGDMIVPAGSVPTATAGTALADTVNLKHANNDALNGAEVFIYAATTASAAGQSRWIEDYIASSSLVTVTAWTTTPATGDNYEMHSRFRVAEYNEAIDAAHDAVRLAHLLPKIDESIILDNLATNGLMATWASTASLTGWAGSARTGVAGSALTITRESDVIYSRYYSAKLTSPAATTQTSAFYKTIDDFPKYGAETLNVRAWVHCLTASRVRAFAQEGTGTPKYSSYHDGKGWNDSDDLYASTTLSEDLSSLTVGIAIAAGASIDTYLGRFEAICVGKDLLPEQIYEYSIPSGFVAISRIDMETGTHNKYKPLNGSEDWEIVRDATKKLYIASPISRRGVRIYGQQKATKPTADTSTIELNEEFVKAYACWYLLQAKPEAGETGRRDMWKRRADELQYQMSVLAEGKMVEMVG